MRSLVPNMLTLTSLIMLLTLSLSGCDHGSGSGGGSGSDSGSLRISIEPKTISPGSLAFLEVVFRDSGYDDLESHGLTVKLLVPNQIAFISGSASLTRDSGAISIAPIFYDPAPQELVKAVLAEAGVEPPADAAAADEFSFLVFSLPPSLIESEDNGVIQLSLNVTGTPKVASIYGDLDRVAVTEFSATAPDFDLEAQQDVQIVDPTAAEEES